MPPQCSQVPREHGGVEKHTDTEKLERERLAALQELYSTAHGWVQLPLVEQWKSQWDESLRARRKFLVIEGPTSIGKSHFCLALCGHNKTLHVDCSKGGEPDLRAYDHTAHEAG